MLCCWYSTLCLDVASISPPPLALYRVPAKPVELLGEEEGGESEEEGVSLSEEEEEEPVELEMAPRKLPRMKR